jgi:curved DNA-binding protein CbpA
MYPHFSNHYAILGIPLYTCNEAYIQEAYQTQSRIFHPNRNRDPGAREWFQAVEQAYEVLTDVEARTTYDLYLQEEEQRRQRQSDRWMEWEHQHRQQQDYYWYYDKKEQTRHAVDRNQSLKCQVHALEATNVKLKATNTKLWDEVSCHVAKKETLQRETATLTSQLKATYTMFYLRERGYVSKIRTLQQNAASLGRTLQQQEESSEHATASAKKRLFVKIVAENYEKKWDHTTRTVDGTPVPSNCASRDLEMDLVAVETATGVEDLGGDKENASSTNKLRNISINPTAMQEKENCVRISNPSLDTTITYRPKSAAHTMEETRNIQAKRRKTLGTVNR